MEKRKKRNLPLTPHKPHEDAVKVFAVAVGANLIRGALSF